MRLWSLHPCYLDTKGLVAAWREALLARAVLRGKTRGYRNHPQLARFRAHPSPVSAINLFLRHLHEEATSRGYRFDVSKIGPVRNHESIPVTDGQMDYERKHLLSKLEQRSPGDVPGIPGPGALKAHPLFRVRPGEVEPWEITH